MLIPAGNFFTRSKLFPVFGKEEKKFSRRKLPQIYFGKETGEIKSCQ